MKNVMIIGVGPHSKRIYFYLFKKFKIIPKIVVDLESNNDATLKYLDENGFSSSSTWFLPDCYKDDEKLPKKYEKELLSLCREKNITHIIVSTEPKAHCMYLNFALDNNINILSDKPITVVKNMYDLKNINKIRTQYYELLKKYKNSSCSCKIMCQRQYHRGYIFIKKVLREVINKYNIPITYIDIYHCDGNWEMPHDLNKENHPYKYGYGKLFHSGYHFIDLLTDLLKLNDLCENSKKICSGSIFGSIFTPTDEMAVFNKNDFQRFFGKEEVDRYSIYNRKRFNNYGEKNFYGQLNFKNKNKKIITTVNLNLLHYGFSRRGWFKSRDYYKKNGRIRHERVNIQVGPLLNIQVHSYQSKEIKDRKDNIYETSTGGLEHFDIDIYRNVDLIGGKPFERISLKDLYDDKIEKNGFIGYNEYSREEFLKNFLNNKGKCGDFKNQEFSIEILYSAAKTIYDVANNIIPLERINIPKNEGKN